MPATSLMFEQQMRASTWPTWRICVLSWKLGGVWLRALCLRSCSWQYATDVTTLPGFEAWLAGTLQKKKITLDKSVILVVTDFSKLGAAQQAIVNRHVAVIQSMTDRNPEGGNDWE